MQELGPNGMRDCPDLNQPSMDSVATTTHTPDRFVNTKGDSGRFKRKKTPSAHSVVSYFAGCGGMDLGFIGDFEVFNTRLDPTGFQIVKAYDFEDRCVTTYKENIAGHIEHRDISDLSVTDVPKADVLIGGFPCQDFSSCGPKRGLSSSRGQLYLSMIDYMKTHSPKVVVGENVPHLARMHQGEVLRTILRDLSNTGYKVQLWDLYAPDYGVPQNRRRLFFICVRPDLFGFPKEPTAEFQKDTGYRTIEWAIDDLKSIDDETVSNQSQYFRASKAKKGNGQGDEKSKRDQPAYTVRANAKSRVQFHYELERRLTVRECARLQTFPDNFVFPHSATTNVMQIGNAVPPLLAHKVASSIADFLVECDDNGK